MGLFTSKKPIIREKQYRVIPGARNRAIAEAAQVKRRRLGPLNLKKDMASYFHRHEKDKLDTRRRSSQSIANDMRESLNRSDTN